MVKVRLRVRPAAGAVRAARGVADPGARRASPAGGRGADRGRAPARLGGGQHDSVRRRRAVRRPYQPPGWRWCTSSGAARHRCDRWPGSCPISRRCGRRPGDRRPVLRRAVHPHPQPGPDRARRLAASRPARQRRRRPTPPRPPGTRHRGPGPGRPGGGRLVGRGHRVRTDPARPGRRHPERDPTSRRARPRPHRQPARPHTRPEDITLFNSVGVAAQDMATARLVVDAAWHAGAGRALDLGAGSTAAATAGARPTTVITSGPPPPGRAGTSRRTCGPPAAQTVSKGADGAPSALGCQVCAVASRGWPPHDRATAARRDGARRGRTGHGRRTHIG